MHHMYRVTAAKVAEASVLQIMVKDLVVVLNQLHQMAGLSR